jgi:hypothetical protein
VAVGAFALVGRNPEPAERGPESTPEDSFKGPGGAAKIPVPAASEFTGLKFYLACESVKSQTVVESVSGGQVGRAHRVELTEGVRGKAFRLTHDGTTLSRCALDLSGQKQLFTIEANAPFTLAFWVRRPHLSEGGEDVLVFEALPGPTYAVRRGLEFRLFSNLSPGAAFTVTEQRDRKDPGTLHAATTTRVANDPSQWHHFALARSERGEIRSFVNGSGASTADNLFPPEIRYYAIHFMRSLRGKATIDLDEFCLFNRSLTDAELRKLAGCGG